MKHIYSFTLLSLWINIPYVIPSQIFFFTLFFFCIFLFFNLFTFSFFCLFLCLFGWSTNIPRKNTLCSPLRYKLRFLFLYFLFGFSSFFYFSARSSVFIFSFLFCFFLPTRRFDFSLLTIYEHPFLFSILRNLTGLHVNHLQHFQIKYVMCIMLGFDFYTLHDLHLWLYDYYILTYKSVAILL